MLNVPESTSFVQPIVSPNAFTDMLRAARILSDDSLIGLSFFFEMAASCPRAYPPASG